MLILDANCEAAKNSLKIEFREKKSYI